MLIDDPGPKIESDDLAALEAKSGAVLPESYRNFLLEHNGGIPTPDVVDIRGLPGTPTDVQVFFGIGRTVESNDLAWNLRFVAYRCPGMRAVPIACDSGGNLFCLAIESDIETEVIYCDLESPDCTSYVVAPSFEQFIDMLRPWEQ